MLTYAIPMNQNTYVPPPHPTQNTGWSFQGRPSKWRWLCWTTWRMSWCRSQKKKVVRLTSPSQLSSAEGASCRPWWKPQPPQPTAIQSNWGPWLGHPDPAGACLIIGVLPKTSLLLNLSSQLRAFAFAFLMTSYLWKVRACKVDANWWLYLQRCRVCGKDVWGWLWRWWVGRLRRCKRCVRPNYRNHA